MIYLSLGAGVQSTALLVLASQKKCPVPEVAIFADTQDEPRWVYDHLKVLQGWSPIPIEVVTAGKLSEHPPEFLRIPAFTAGRNGDESMLRRQCTREYKITPIQTFVRERLGIEYRKHSKGRYATALIGISLDEAHRMKDSIVPFIRNTYPLVDLGLHRSDCLEIISTAGLPVPKKSACVFCPYHDDPYWRELKTEHPEEFARAVEYDRKIRDSTRAGFKLPAYIHRSLVPLSDVDLSDPYKDQLELFGEECEGMCGV